MKNQTDSWLRHFDNKIQLLEESITYQEQRGLGGISSRLIVDNRGNILDADPDILKELNIKSSLLFNRMSSLNEDQILVLLYPDLIEGKSSVFFTKRVKELYYIKTFSPIKFFPLNPTEINLQIKSNDLVLYSSSIEEVGQIKKVPFIKIQAGRISLSQTRALSNTDRLDLVVFMDISRTVYVVLLIIFILTLYLLRFSKSSLKIQNRLKVLNEEHLQLVDLIHDMSEISMPQVFDFSSKLDGLIKSFESFLAKIGEFDFWFEEHKEYAEVLNSYLSDILLLMKKIKEDSSSIKKMEAYLSNMINSMPSQIISLDSHKKITQWNHETQRISGILRDKAIDQVLDELIPGLSDLNEPIDNALKTREKQTITQQRRKSEGRDVYEDITVFPLINNGVEGVVVRIDDVTEKVKLLEDMLQSQKMDAIGHLAGGIAHDFNNMLGGIMGAVELIKMVCKDIPKANDYINIITEATERAASLAKDLLSFARKRPVGSTAVDIHEIINSSLKILEKTMDRRIEIIKKLEARETYVIGEESQLQNIFMNLAINASHAMPEGGELSFQTSNVRLNSSDCELSSFDIFPGEYICIHIRDSGFGMSKKILERIFEPFFTTKDDKGTGMGLSTVYGTVQRHHGSINVYSEEGVGTSFTIHIPLSDKTSLSKKELDLPIISGQGTILLVDDERLMLTTGKALLEEMGFEVLTAVNGEQAVEIYERRMNEIDLVILDMIMPVMNGTECFKKLKEYNPEVIVIIASGFTKEEELEEAKKSGLFSFIPKPYRSIELSQAVYKGMQKVKK